MLAYPLSVVTTTVSHTVDSGLYITESIAHFDPNKLRKGEKYQFACHFLAADFWPFEEVNILRARELRPREIFPNPLSNH